MKKNKSRTVTYGALIIIWMVIAGAAPVCGQPADVRIAVLTPGLTFTPVHKGLQEGLARFEYRESRNVRFIVEDTKGSAVNLTARIARLLAAKPDVLFTVTTVHTLAAKEATTTVPIVFAMANDPVESGLVAGYVSSKNNMTGVTSFDASLTGKRLEIFLEVAPNVKRILVLAASMPNAGLISFPFLEKTAKKLGVQLVRRDVSNREEIERVLRELPKKSVDGIYYLPAALVRSNIDLLIKKAQSERIPLGVMEDSLVAMGALFSYGPDSRLVGMQAARLVDRVLKGINPSDIVVEIPERLFLSVNVTTAKEIGLKIPGRILERTDRLIK